MLRTRRRDEYLRVLGAGSPRTQGYVRDVWMCDSELKADFNKNWKMRYDMLGYLNDGGRLPSIESISKGDFKTAKTAFENGDGEYTGLPLGIFYEYDIVTVMMKIKGELQGGPPFFAYVDLNDYADVDSVSIGMFPELSVAIMIREEEACMLSICHQVQVVNGGTQQESIAEVHRVGGDPQLLKTAMMDRLKVAAMTQWKLSHDLETIKLYDVMEKRRLIEYELKVGGFNKPKSTATDPERRVYELKAEELLRPVAIGTTN
jgi:hypothetical protein